MVRRHLEASDPRLITASMLRQAEAALEQLVESLNTSANADPAMNTWIIPVDQADPVLDAFSRWPSLEPVSVLEAQEKRLRDDFWEFPIAVNIAPHLR
jgi:hypothetical protein